MKDLKGREIKTGDVCFYTEMPYSNYADALYYIYEKNGMQMVGCKVVNMNDKYIKVETNDNDLALSAYHKEDGEAYQANLLVIDGLSIDQATVEYAERHYPLLTIMTIDTQLLFDEFKKEQPSLYMKCGHRYPRTPVGDHTAELMLKLIDAMAKELNYPRKGDS